MENYEDSSSIPSIGTTVMGGSSFEQIRKKLKKVHFIGCD